MREQEITISKDFCGQSVAPLPELAALVWFRIKLIFSVHSHKHKISHISKIIEYEKSETKNATSIRKRFKIFHNIRFETFQRQTQFHLEAFHFHDSVERNGIIGPENGPVFVLAALLYPESPADATNCVQSIKFRQLNFNLCTRFIRRRVPRVSDTQSANTVREQHASHLRGIIAAVARYS